MQAGSAAIATPLWCILSLYLNARTPPSTIPAVDSKTFLPAILLGYGVPSGVMAAHRKLFTSTSAHQGIIAAWQAFPIYISLVAFAFKAFLGRAQPESPQDIKSARRHLIFIYKVLGLLAAAGHIMACFSIILSPSPLKAFQATFVPVSAGRNDLLGLVHNFFLWDGLVSLTSAALYAFYIKPSDISPATFLTSLLLLGPGYTLTFVSMERDKILHRPKQKRG
jgi:hypothetical protein